MNRETNLIGMGRTDEDQGSLGQLVHVEPVCFPEEDVDHQRHEQPHHCLQKSHIFQVKIEGEMKMKKWRKMSYRDFTSQPNELMMTSSVTTSCVGVGVHEVHWGSGGG